MNRPTITILGYTITTEANPRDNAPLPPEVAPIIERLHRDARDKRKIKIIGELKTLIEKYPRLPVLQNYLSVAYTVRGSGAKAVEINRKLAEEFPDYLFGKLNMAADAYNKHQYELMPQWMGPTMKLKDLYPGKTVFHIGEVASYYQMAVRYFAAMKNKEEAEERFALLEELSSDEMDFSEEVFAYMMPLRLESMSSLFAKKKNKRPVKTTGEMLPVQTKEPPQFIHSEVAELYKTDLPAAPELIERLLQLPRATLIQDLKTILQDTARRFRYYEEEWAIESIDNEDDFALHALMLLGELEAEEALPDVLTWLSTGEEFLDFWLGDHITETIWEPLYKMGRRQFHLLEEFLKSTDGYTFSKTAVSNVIVQAVLRYPERRQEAIDLYGRVLSSFENEDPDTVPEFVSMAISDAIDIKAKELLPQIRTFFEKDMVDTFITGSLKELQKEMEEEPMAAPRPLLPLVERYRQITDTWHGYKDDDEEEEEDDEFEDAADDDEEWMLPESVTTQIVRTGPKVGRNDPCPCGSGKKYKKCCLADNT